MLFHSPFRQSARGRNIFLKAAYKFLIKKQQDIIDVINEHGQFDPPTPFEHTVSLVKGYIDLGAKMGELLVKEYEFYRAVYCGVCRSTKAQLGSMANILHSYDSVFLALVRMLYIPDSEIGAGKHRCIAHPIKRKTMLNTNDATDYTAKAFAILTYYKVRDDISDERLAKRMGFTKFDDPYKVELDLAKIVPKKDRSQFCHQLVFHGRAICDSRKPKCDVCPIAHLCPKNIGKK